MINHALAQPPLRPGDGPIGLVLAPTRELAQQVTSKNKHLMCINTVHLHILGLHWNPEQ